MVADVCPALLPVSVKKHSSREEDPWEDKPSEFQMRGWRAVSASGLQGKGSPKRSCFFTDAGILASECPPRVRGSQGLGPLFRIGAREPAAGPRPRQSDAPALFERLAEYGWEPHRDRFAPKCLSRASDYRRTREKQGGAASSNSRFRTVRFRTVLFRQYSANLTISTVLVR